MAIKKREGFVPNEIEYHVNGHTYTIVKSKKLPNFEKLELCKKIYDNINTIFTSEFFKLFIELKDVVTEQNKLFGEINTFSRQNKQEVKFITQNIEEIKSNAEEYENKLNKYLISNNLGKISDLVIDSKISNNYVKCFFTDDFWFEIFCYYMFLKYIQSKKNSYKRGKDFEIILSQDIKSKSVQHQIDIIIILKNHLIIVSCKSGKEGRNHALAFAKQKADIQADFGIIKMFNPFTDSYDGSHENVYIINNIKSKSFNKVEKEIDEIIGKYL